MTRTILIVDDDAEVVRTFSDWLRLEGHQVRTAANGEQALDWLGDADAIFVDLRMPILDGLAFLRCVRERGSRVPVAVVTGDYLIDDSLLTEFATLGARVLFKPLWVDELVTVATEMTAQAVHV